MSSDEAPDVPFEAVADFIRERQGLRARDVIYPESQLERDLGITGDDGAELIEGALRRFGIELEIDGPLSFRALFRLESDEYLFHSEGLGPMLEVLSLFNTPVVRSFSAGELHEVLNRGRRISAEHSREHRAL